MAKGNPRDPERERIWRRHLRQQRLSGLTVRDYCAEWRLRETAFHFWRREIAARDGERRAMSALAQHRPGAAKRPRRRSATTSTKTPAFVPVTLVESRPRPHAAIDIRLPSGHRLRVRPGCDAQLLTQVLTLLEGRAC